MNLIKDNYPFEVDEDELIITAVKSMLKSLDLTATIILGRSKSLYGSLSGFSGVGMYIEDRDGYVGVVAPIRGQPAERQGLKLET